MTGGEQTVQRYSTGEARAVLRAGLVWLYDTVQPDGAIPSHHGYSCNVGERRIRFIGAGFENLPVVVTSVAAPQYQGPPTERVLINPVGGEAEMTALIAALNDLGATTGTWWNGNHESGSVQLLDPANPSLLAGLKRYHDQCPTHRTVFCGSWQASKGEEDCRWLRDGRALVVQPAWPM